MFFKNLLGCNKIGNRTPNRLKSYPATWKRSLSSGIRHELCPNCDSNVEKIRIICSAQAAPEDLFKVSSLSSRQVEDQRALIDDLGITENEGASLSMFTAEEELFAFDRTVSRLTEMQTRQYWESGYVKYTKTS